MVRASASLIQRAKRRAKSSSAITRLCQTTSAKNAKSPSKLSGPASGLVLPNTDKSRLTMNTANDKPRRFETVRERAA